MDYFGFLIFLGIIAAAIYLGKSHFRSGFDADIESHLTFKAQNTGIREFCKFNIFVHSGIIHGEFRLRMDFPHKFELNITNILAEESPLKEVITGDAGFDEEISVYSNDFAKTFAFLSESVRFDLLQLNNSVVFTITTRYIEMQGETRESFAHALTTLQSLLHGWSKKGSIKESLINSMNTDSSKSVREKCAYHLEQAFSSSGNE